MFGITNQTYTGEGDFLVGFCLVCRLQGGIYYFFFYKITALIKRSIKQKTKKWNQNKMKKIGFKRVREIHFVPDDYWLHYRKRSSRPPKNVWKLLCRFNAVAGSNFILPKTWIFVWIRVRFSFHSELIWKRLVSKMIDKMWGKSFGG